MTAISLREAAKQLREAAADRRAFPRPGSYDDIADQYDALATLLDGDGEGGLLGEHDGNGTSVCRKCVVRIDAFGSLKSERAPCPTLTLVAAYVSAVRDGRLVQA